VCVGSRARAIGEAAFEDGMHESDVLFFEDSTEAAEKIPALIKEEDIVLVKGSQGIRLERLMEVLIANPEDVSELVRQESEWKKR
jgi:UDP-N-acetylmuramyl pentapeptide synthase